MPKTKKSKEERAAELSRMVAEAVRLEFDRHRELRKRRRVLSDEASSSDSDGEFSPSSALPMEIVVATLVNRWRSSSPPAGRCQVARHKRLVPLVRMPLLFAAFPLGPCPRLAV